MNTSKIVLFATAGASLLLLPGCEAFESLMIDQGVADQLLANDVISPEQHAALTGNGWGEILRGVINTASTLLIGIPVIQKVRGPSASAEERVARTEAKKARKSA